MDIATIIGIIIGTGFIIMGITLDGNLLNFYNLASIIIVLGGTVAATLVAYPLKKVIESMKIAKKAFSSKELNPGQTIGKIIEIANVARREGLLALEEASESIEDEFLQKGVMLIVDGTDPELVRNILETELSFLEQRHGSGKSIFDLMGSLAPAFGMIGTLIGLINMLQRLDDPKAVGPSMAIALITTFYGSVLANLVFIPIATKLKNRSKEEILIKEIMVEGLLSIQAGENPRIIEEKLKAFLPPQTRRDMEKSKNEGVEA